MEKDILEKDLKMSNLDIILIEKNQLIENYETDLITIKLKMNESENKIQYLLHQVISLYTLFYFILFTLSLYY